MRLFKKKQESKPVPRRRLAEYSIEDGVRPRVAELDTSNSRTATPTHQNYRRNQTVSGHRRSDQTEESERQKSHQLVMQRRRLSVAFIIAASVAVLLLVGLWQFIAKPIVVFSDTEITQQIDTAEYVRTIEEYVAKAPSQRLRATLDQAALSAYVSAAHGEVARVSLSGGLSLPSQVSFTVSFRKPLVGWQMRGSQYFVDKDGVVFSKNYFQAPLVKVVDESGITPEQGSAVASSRLLGFLGRVVDQAGERGYTVTEAILPEEATRRVDIKLEGGESRVRFTVDRGAGVQVEDMDRAMKFFKGNGRAMPQYIDVRVAGRAAYR